MDLLNVKIHLMLPAIFSLAAIILLLILRKSLVHRYKILWRGLVIFFVFYLIIVGGAFFQDYYLSWLVSKFKNADGVINYRNLNPQQKSDWDNYINDTGRNFSIITGFIFAAVISAFYFLVALLNKFLNRKTDYAKS